MRIAKVCRSAIRYLGTCYDMATYPCIYVYDAPGIKPSSLWQLWSWNLIFLELESYIPELGLVPKFLRPVRPVADLYDLLAS